MIDMIENFIVFSEQRGGLAKIIAKNHQFLGVRNAVSAVAKMDDNRGRLGVFWHTQGSGKSFSMVFFLPVCPPQDSRQLDVFDCDRPQRAGQADIQELCELRFNQRQGVPS